MLLAGMHQGDRIGVKPNRQADEPRTPFTDHSGHSLGHSKSPSKVRPTATEPAPEGAPYHPLDDPNDDEKAAKSVEENESRDRSDEIGR